MSARPIEGRREVESRLHIVSVPYVILLCGRSGADEKNRILDAGSVDEESSLLRSQDSESQCGVCSRDVNVAAIEAHRMACPKIALGGLLQVGPEKPRDVWKGTSDNFK